VQQQPFQTVLASDILLYVAQYPNLLASLHQLFVACPTLVFVMCWARKIPEDRRFFEQAAAMGLAVDKVADKVWRFTLAPCVAVRPAVAGECVC
jgi:hypothetical protein